MKWLRKILAVLLVVAALVLVAYGFSHMADRQKTDRLSRDKFRIEKVPFEAGLRSHGHEQESADTITIHYDYLHISLSREDPRYTDEQLADIEWLLMQRAAAFEFATYEALGDYHGSLWVPGYGASGGGLGDQTTAGRFTFVGVEVPEKRRHRIMVYRQQDADSPYRLFDEFYHESDLPPIMTVYVEDGEARYRLEGSREIIRRKGLGEESGVEQELTNP